MRVQECIITRHPGSADHSAEESQPQQLRMWHAAHMPSCALLPPFHLLFLMQMGVTDGARYLTSNSGGSWLNAAFSFQQKVGWLLLRAHTA